MWERFTMRSKVLGVLGALMLINLLGGGVMVWYTYRIETLLIDVAEKNMAAYQSAESLAISLVNQKGFVSYYFMDGDPDWLRQLGEYRQIFKERLQEAQAFNEGGEGERILKTVAAENGEYVRSQDIVISHYEAGQREAGAALHYETRKRFFRILELCSYYREMYAARTLSLEKENKQRAHSLRLVAVGGVTAALLLGLLLAVLLVGGILMPLRKLAEETGREGGAKRTKNVMENLSHNVHGLLAEYDQTTSSLEKSRAHLLQAEKMAVVGKLAAGMAHSIRNPFTSVQMRLFSLKRALDLEPVQEEDFEVIAEEIRHIDTIVQNFLEFSRAPRMKFQATSLSIVVDHTLQLLKHRLNSYDVRVRLVREKILPEVEADPEQIKEVLVNIIINACEMMSGGGEITIREAVLDHPLGKAASISLSDTGPGIPEQVQAKLFDPFFTTKEEGTGLGLSIVKRIIAEHRGTIDLVAGENRGATFIIRLPVKGALY